MSSFAGMNSALAYKNPKDFSQLVFQVDKSEVPLGGSVTFTGTNPNQKDSDVYVSFQTFDENGDPTYPDECWAEIVGHTSATDGSFSIPFTIPDSFIPRTYGFELAFTGPGHGGICYIPDAQLIVTTATSIDKSSLQSAITSANSNKASVIVSLDGSDVEAAKNWVTKEIMATYEAAIATAQKVLNKSDAAQAEVNQAVTDLGTATGTFDNAKKAGTNVVVSKTVSIRVEGISSKIIKTGKNYTTKKSTVYDALCELLQKENIPIIASDSQYGKFISSISNEAAGTFGGYDGWMYCVNGVDGATSSDFCSINDGDDIVFYYGGLSPQTYIPKVSLSAAEVSAGTTFTASITATYFDWNTNSNVTVNVTGADIKLLDQTYTTDANGQAVITAPATAGDYTLEISQDRLNNYPLLVRTTQSIKVVPKTITFPVTRQTIVDVLNKATDKLIEKFDDSRFNYQQHWMAIAINGFGKKVPGSYLNAINGGDMPAKNSGQYGKYILGILAAGGDPTNINGRNLLAELCQLSDMKSVNTQGGIYTTPFGLLALDAVNYQIPSDAGFTRDDIINKLITLASPTGGEDGVGFVLTALGKYYNEKPAVKAAVDSVISAWATRQDEDGGFGAGAWSTENNVNTSAQVLMGLSFNGKDPQSEQFTKAKGNLVSFLLSLQNEDGTFNWQKNNTGSISMATEQVVYALDQYLRQLDGKKSIYDFTEKVPQAPDITAPVISTDLVDKSVNASVFTFAASANDAIEGPVVPVVKLGNKVVEGTNGTYRVELREGTNAITVSAVDTSGNKSEKSFTIVYTAKAQGIPAGDKPKVEIPSDNNDYKVTITTGDSNKEITIEIPDSNAAKVLAELPLNSSLPGIMAVKGNVTVLLPKGIKVTSGNASQIELITSKDTTDTAIKNKVNDIIPAGKKLDSIVQAFTVGGSESIEFDGYVTLTFKGMQGKEAAYIQSGILHPIQKYASDSVGLASGKSEYAYDSGSDLIVKSKHFTDYVVYSASAVQTPDSGGTTPQIKKYVTLSVDKLTINEGYVISSTQIELQSGDTAWTLLKRELDKRNISCKYIWTEAYGSVYVQSIDGDGEFDHGSGSGWMYNVNDWYPNYGATKYTLKDGDKLQWRYTTNLGADLGEDLSQWQNNPGGTASPGGQTPVISDKTPTIEVPKDSTKDLSNTENLTIGTNSIDLKKVYKDEGTISSWAYNAIGTATQKGFVGGNNGKFNPKDSITRAEFTKIMVSVLGLDTKVEKVINFTDVKADNWFYPYVNAAYKAGIVSGSGNKFNPNEKITREQMAAIIIRALGVKPIKPATAIKDMNGVSAYFRTDVETIFAIGLMVGDNGQFNPKGLATREMAAVVAMKAYEYRNGEHTKITEVKKYIEETGAFMQKTVSNPVIGSIGGEWTVLSLARSGINVTDSYYSKYYSNVEKKLQESSGKLHNVKYTEYDRVILALGSIGKDVTNVDGYDLTKPLADFNTLIKQGLNGPIWALIALDSKGYQIPVDKDVAVQTTREKLVDYILSKEIKGGGWSLTSEAPADTDITAMALQALSRYRNNEKAEAAIERALSFLSATQQMDGSFISKWGDEASSESIAQVIVALSSLNIDPKTDKRFIKNGNDMLTALLAFYVDGGGFKHTLTGELDAMATDQGMYALVAYDRFSVGQKPLYDMMDVKNDLAKSKS